VRKAGVYRLLLRLGGEARWKHLKANLRELGWGPTTLKQVLDQMVEEGSVIKEARLGAEGAEVWYRVQVKDDDVWEPFKRALKEGKEASMQPIAATIRKRLEQLEGKEKEVFLKSQLRKILEMARDTCAALFYMEARGAKKLGKHETLTLFDYVFDTIFKEQIKEYLEIFLEYPEDGMEVVDSLLKEAAEKEKTSQNNS